MTKMDSPDECESGVQMAAPGGGSIHLRRPSASAGLDDGGPSAGGSVNVTQGPGDTDAAWEALYEWAYDRCWGPDCALTLEQQFQAYVDKLTELGLPVEGPQPVP